MNDPHNQDIILLYTNSRIPFDPGKSWRMDYDDSGVANLPPDAVGVMTHGKMARPPVDGFLGSYNESVALKSYDPDSRTGTLSLHVWNTSGWESFGHSLNPALKLLNWRYPVTRGLRPYDIPVGPGASIREDFYWTTSFTAVPPIPISGGVSASRVVGVIG
jgi:hypothetical protein